MELDALAAEGLVFTRAYATGTRTVRGLEALVASFPPIPSESIVKRPGNEGIAGAFLREAARHDWFDHTLFVIAGDHGARVYGAADMPLYSYEIPIRCATRTCC